MPRSLLLLMALALGLSAEEPETACEVGTEPDVAVVTAPLLAIFEEGRQALVKAFATTGSGAFHRAG